MRLERGSYSVKVQGESLFFICTLAIARLKLLSFLSKFLMRCMRYCSPTIPTTASECTLSPFKSLLSFLTGFAGAPRKEGTVPKVAASSRTDLFSGTPRDHFADFVCDCIPFRGVSDCSSSTYLSGWQNTDKYSQDTFESSSSEESRNDSQRVVRVPVTHVYS
ncbi:hypothetical protein BKA93DRAFT_406035 [Sparassis latifolia]